MRAQKSTPIFKNFIDEKQISGYDKNNKTHNMGWTKMKWLKTRKGTALLMFLISVLFAVALGGLFSLFQRRFLNSALMMYLLFSAPMSLAAVLLLITNIPDDFVWGIACGCYYGTLGIAVLIEKLGWDMSDEARFTISAVIAVLICYIVWLKKKPKEK
jgi:hypothetical protein